jgi:hypothetical protein
MLSYERNPSYFQRSLTSAIHQTVIGRISITKELVGMFARSLFPAHINGNVATLGYLSDLRIQPRYRNRIRLVRDGFETLKTVLHDPKLTPFYLTSIVAGNRVARRLLEAGLEGLPVYEIIGAFDTMAIKTRGSISKSAQLVQHAKVEDADRIVSFITEINRVRQFSPVLTRAELLNGHWNGLAIEDFLLFERGGDLLGTIAVWDQSHFRQAVVHGYRKDIAAIRPIVNSLSFFTGLPRLPRQGTHLHQVFLAFLCVQDDDPFITRILLEAGLFQARARGTEFALIGAPAGSKPQRNIRHEFRCNTYESLMYLVYWPDGERAVSEVRGRPPFVESGVL